MATYLSLYLAGAVIAAAGAWLVFGRKSQERGSWVRIARPFFGCVAFVVGVGLLSVGRWIAGVIVEPSEHAPAPIAARLTAGEVCQAFIALQCSGNCYQEMDFSDAASCIEDGVSHCLGPDSPEGDVDLDRALFEGCIEKGRNTSCLMRSSTISLCVIASQSY